ncbi:GAF domain-containing sensor histidine kinase [Pseudofrankia inefficax]|uniref:histidine kinase n=1 Tax=Pseudofrankia inefficax (strain DSM 45817 / CECT 9037 / DDB 130130 / EuI1c) TaxID=298654 RepID=E3J9R9_PSEI1|nr:GAF domain-containing protein [Pseudofrankia inefficax]ADP84572.1 GAF sensor signal transduction histidine kinase [Pseudofrankia inefficax]
MLGETDRNLARSLCEEQALRRVATLIAEGSADDVALAAVVAEAAELYAPAHVQVVHPAGVATTEARFAVEAPVLVDGTLWGVLVAASDEPLAPSCAARLADFAHLMATAIANGRTRDELRAVAEAQGSLRKVATLVAQDASPQAVFAAVAVEAARILRVGAVSLVKFDADTLIYTKIYGTHGERAAVVDGGTWPIEDCPEGALILQTGQPVRIDDWTFLPGPVAARHREQGFGQCVAAPVHLDGALWGHIAAFGEADDVLPDGSETRLADFTQLMASAIANAQAREHLRSLAEQQGAALRRVATLVGQRASPGMIFDAVAAEASRALRVSRVDVGRCHGDGRVTLLGSTDDLVRSNGRAFSRGGELVTARVRETGSAARIDDWAALPTEAAGVAAREGFRSVVGAPIRVDSTLWGVIVVLAEEPLAAGIETRLTDFTHLVASSVANVQARDNLIASRARIVAASDEVRRRIERDLHDGLQQRLIALGLGLRAARAKSALPADLHDALTDVARGLDDVLEEVRIYSQGLHPPLLSRSGLGPALRTLARRAPIPVALTADGVPRLPEPVETAVYYTVSEALANAAKHSQAPEVTVSVEADAGTVRATIADQGVGGAAIGPGSGLVGLVDRIEALGGRFTLVSPIGQGTRIDIELPLTAQTIGDLPTP